MNSVRRKYDIDALSWQPLTVFVDGQPIAAAPGETVIGVLDAIGQRGFARNDHHLAAGGYCWMGVCHACLVKIDGCYKRRACQTVVAPGMHIETGCNRFDEIGLAS